MTTHSSSTIANPIATCRLVPPPEQRVHKDHDKRADGTALAPFPEFTAREREILDLVAQGLTNAAITRGLRRPAV